MRARGKRNESREVLVALLRTGKRVRKCSRYDAGVGESRGGGRVDVAVEAAEVWSGMGLRLLLMRRSRRFPRTAGKPTDLKLGEGSESEPLRLYRSFERHTLKVQESQEE